MPAVPPSTCLTITDPIVAYRTLISLKRIRPDPAQHRLALQLQKLYYRLKDYNPELEYRDRIDRVVRSLQQTPIPNGAQQSPNATRRGLFPSIFSNGPQDPSLALTRTIPLQESALKISSPQGMLLYGEVGRGKSMLLDLLADSLPSRKKRRWHFNTFMLDMFRKLESLRTQRLALPSHLRGMETEHSVLSLAKDTVSTSPILFLDEFQMPDRAASKLLNTFLTSFFHLGGVLIATSNRMPEELAKAAGVEFAAPGPNTFGSLMGWTRGGWSEGQGQRQARTDFGAFLEVLRARCEVWEMEGERDWRREVSVEEDDEGAADAEAEADGSNSASLTTTATKSSAQSAQSPPHYHILFPPSTPDALTSHTSFTSDLTHLLGTPHPTFTPTTLRIYGRRVPIPSAHPSSGAVLFPFTTLCSTPLGPADYITLASTYHTLILTDVPVLTALLKNEARRFITLLDALYEARCRLLVSAAAPVDGLFFPEGNRVRGGTAVSGVLDERDERDRGVESGSRESVYQETFSEIYQDSTAPFRPNVSLYADGQDAATPMGSTGSQNQQLRSVLADEDADFGPTYGNGRGLPGAGDSRYGTSTAEQERRLSGGPDFSKTALLTGEDERFAYKRARSRLWEMCGERWWREREGKRVEEWWRPVRVEGRFWEGRGREGAEREKEVEVDEGVRKEGSSSSSSMAGTEKDESLFRHGASPFRTRTDSPPRFGWQHAWGMMTWGRKAGEWGKGVEGDRGKTGEKT